MAQTLLKVAHLCKIMDIKMLNYWVIFFRKDESIKYNSSAAECGTAKELIRGPVKSIILLCRSRNIYFYLFIKDLMTVLVCIITNGFSDKVFAAVCGHRENVTTQCRWPTLYELGRSYSPVGRFIGLTKQCVILSIS